MTSETGRGSTSEETILTHRRAGGFGKVLDCRGSWACDAEEWQDAGGVAGVAAQRGGDVAVTVPPQGGDR
jgi:hypothetical protein